MKKAINHGVNTKTENVPFCVFKDKNLIKNTEDYDFEHRLMVSADNT